MRCILLHGLGQSAASWNDVVKAMDQTWDILCPELSKWKQNDVVCYADLYSGLVKYCAQFEGPLDLCGLSLGGILALQYGIEHPDRVNSLVLIGTQYKMPKMLLKFQNILFHLMPKRTFEKIGFEKNDFINLCRSMLDLDFQANLKQLRCSVQIICGEKDGANRAASLEMKEQIQNAKFLMISGAGHEVNRDEPVKLATLIESFFKENS